MTLEERARTFWTQYENFSHVVDINAATVIERLRRELEHVVGEERKACAQETEYLKARSFGWTDDALHALDMAAERIRARTSEPAAGASS